MSNGRSLSREQINDLQNECTIEIREASLEDHGTWTCQATEDPFARSGSHVETSVEVKVVSPYELQMLPRSNDILTLINDTLVEEVICVTKGSSLVRPVIDWISDGKFLDPEEINITEWVVSNCFTLYFQFSDNFLVIF